jgi:membrane peptidoglycan carboxypeptidase
MMSNSNVSCNKYITITLFVSLIITIVVVIVYAFVELVYKKVYDNFENKRDFRVKMYKSDEILDPDEDPEDEELDLDNAPSKLYID